MSRMFRRLRRFRQAVAVAMLLALSSGSALAVPSIVSASPTQNVCSSLRNWNPPWDYSIYWYPSYYPVYDGHVWKEYGWYEWWTFAAGDEGIGYWYFCGYVTH